MGEGDLRFLSKEPEIATRDIIIFGGYQAGKSSVIRTLLNEDAPSECTVGLSYSYYRAKSRNNEANSHGFHFTDPFFENKFFDKSIPK